MADCDFERRQNMKLTKIFACMAVLGSFATAGIITADYNESLDLPGDGSSGPRIEQLLGVSLPDPTSPQLTAANITSNPSEWDSSLNVSFDPTTDILSLFGDGGNDYQIITVTLSNLVFDVPGQVVIGITPISVGNAVVPDTGDADPTLTTTPFFTANSFGVTYSAANISTTSNDFDITTDTDTFQVELGAAVPEPGTIWLMVIGAAAMATWRRRRTA
jgi:PEP-CTERM motif